MQPLKLVALDSDDLEVISAHLQDSEVKPGEILWRPAEKRVVVAMARFDWSAAHGEEPVYQRCRAALRFERVQSCQAKGMSLQDTGTTLTLLAVDFNESDSPAGHVTLMFDGGAALRLAVECLEGEVADIGPVWAAEKCPERDLGELETGNPNNRLA